MSSGHVFTVASGYGLRVIPASAPYRFRRGGSAHGLEVECQHADGWRTARITPTAGALDYELGPRTAALSEVADVEVVAAHDAWWIETSLYRIPLPTAWTVHASGEDNTQVMFDLVGPANADIFLRVPRRMPSLESLCAPGHAFRDTGQHGRAAWIEFDYLHDGRGWIQRHELLHLEMMPLVITLQVPSQAFDACRPTLAEITERVERCSAGR